MGNTLPHVPITISEEMTCLDAKKKRSRSLEEEVQIRFDLGASVNFQIRSSACDQQDKLWNLQVLKSWFFADLTAQNARAVRKTRRATC